MTSAIASSILNNPILRYLDEWAVIIADRTSNSRFVYWKLDSNGFPHSKTVYELPKSQWTLGGGMTKKTIALVETVSSDNTSAVMMREICRWEFVDNDSGETMDPLSMVRDGTFGPNVSVWAKDVLSNVEGAKDDQVECASAPF